MIMTFFVYIELIVISSKVPILFYAPIKNYENFDNGRKKRRDRPQTDLTDEVIVKTG